MTTELLVDGKTTAQRLFKVFYTVSIPRTFLYNAYQDNTHGVVNTGNASIDAHAMNAPQVVEMCAARMAELHSRGCPITFAKPSVAAPAIYRAIVEHLAEHEAESLRNPFVDAEVHRSRMEDLPKLDDFAAWIYPIAMRYMSAQEIAAPADNTLAGRMAAGRRRPPTRRNVPKEDKDKDLIPVMELPAKYLRKTDDMVERDFMRQSGRNGFI